MARLVLYERAFDAFYNDDIAQRTLVLYVMAMLVIYGNNAPHVEEDYGEGSAREVAVSCYLLAQLWPFISFLDYSFYVKPYRAQIRAHAIGWIISSALWIGSIFADVRGAVALAAVAIM